MAILNHAAKAGRVLIVESAAPGLRVVSRGLRTGWCVALLFVAVMLTGTQRSIQAQSQDDEYRVEAAFLFHFAQMVEWPPDALRSRDNSLLLCTFGEDPFQGKLESTMEGKSVGSRVLRIRHLTQIKGMENCQILFLGKSASKNLGSLLQAVENEPIMTVGETENFIDRGGVLGLTKQENKVRFEINLEAASRARLKISSRLLLLAKRVIGSNGGGR